MSRIRMRGENEKERERNIQRDTSKDTYKRRAGVRKGRKVHLFDCKSRQA